MLVGIKVGLGDVTFGYYLTFLEVILYLSEKCPCPTCPNLKNISVDDHEDSHTRENET